MELAELQSKWQEFDIKLNNLENLNKKLLLGTLSKKPKRKLEWHKFKNLYGIIAAPIILIFVFHPYFKPENFGWKLWVGSLFTLTVIIYIGVLRLKSYLILKGINLGADSIISSAKKILEYKKLINNEWKHAIFYYPIIFIGALLIIWNYLSFDSRTIILLIFIFVITFALNIYAPFKNKERVERMEKEILELKNYTD